MRSPLRLLFAVALVVLPTALSAQISPDPTTSFLSGSNPDGPWRFGMKDAALGTFTDLTVYSPYPGGVRWSDGSTFGGVYYSGDLNLGGGTITLHPFVGGQLAALRFVAPSAGSYSFVGSFLDGDSPTSDVYIALNNSSLLFNAFISNNDPPLAFSSTLSLSAGQYVDFLAGAGGNGYGFDSVNLLLNPQDPGDVGVVPEPASVALLATGLLGLFAVSRARSA